MNQLSNAAAILGKKGGQSGTGKSKARSSEQCRAAISKRWANPEKRFWEKVNKLGKNECWNWSGATVSEERKEGGYGILQINFKHVLAHRMAYIFTFGEIPKGICVCHKCDNTLCCNPNHLFIGTQKDNMVDCSKKGRAYSPNGELAPFAKLSTNQILEIRKQWENKTKTTRQLSNEYGVTLANIWMIVKRKSWKHI